VPFEQILDKAMRGTLVTYGLNRDEDVSACTAWLETHKAEPFRNAVGYLRAGLAHPVKALTSEYSRHRASAV
jgi:hypothetical protein